MGTFYFTFIQAPCLRMDVISSWKHKMALYIYIIKYAREMGFRYLSLSTFAFVCKQTIIHPYRKTSYKIERSQLEYYYKLAKSLKYNKVTTFSYSFSAWVDIHHSYMLWDIQHAHSPFIIMLCQYSYINIMIIAEYILTGIESSSVQNIHHTNQGCHDFWWYGMVIFFQEI